MTATPITDQQRLQDSRPTIGLLISAPEETYQSLLWPGVADIARERDVNLLCFVGGPLRSSSPGEQQDQQNVIYNLASSENVDGVVILSGSLGQLLDPKDVRKFCEHYRPLPMVSIAMALEGIPSVLIDNGKGMRDAVAHLIKVHGYRRIAFVRGPEGHPEAEERYCAYADVLTEHGLPLDPDLVAPGDFSTLAGMEAITLLLDERKLLPQADIEAVVAVDDATALGVIEALQARKIRVPDDVVVVGFDDVDEAKFVTPPLTTVRQPVYELGKRATAMLLSLLAGETVPETVTLPTELVVRQSCGCLAPEIVQAAVEPLLATDETFENAFAKQQEDILSEMVQAVEEPVIGIVAGEMEQLLNTFSAELRGGLSGGFLSALGDVLHKIAAAGGNLTTWQGALSALRRHTLPYLTDDREALPRAENLWQQARLMIGEMAQRSQGYQALRAQERAETSRLVGQEMITTFDVEELMSKVAEGLPRLGIRSCYLSLYEGQDMPAARSRLILAYDENGRTALEAGGQRFLSHQLVPSGMLPQERQHVILIEALYIKEDQIGFVMFETDTQQASTCETLRGQLSSALKGALLFQEHKRTEEALEKAYAEVEKQVDERTTELRREIAERERLQQEIIKAQKQALQELSTPIIPVMDRIIVMPLVGSIDTMRARDITRSLLAGIRAHRAKVVILDITGVPLVDSGVADHLNKTIQAARLKGARSIVTGISDAVAETIVDLGIDWSGIETLSDLQTGLVAALSSLGIKLTR